MVRQRRLHAVVVARARGPQHLEALGARAQAPLHHAAQVRQQRLVHRPRALAAAHDEAHRARVTQPELGAGRRAVHGEVRRRDGIAELEDLRALAGLQVSPRLGKRQVELPHAPVHQPRDEAGIRVLLLHRRGHAPQQRVAHRRPAGVSARAYDEVRPEGAEDLPQPAERLRHGRDQPPVLPRLGAADGLQRQQLVRHPLLRQHPRLHAAPARRRRTPRRRDPAA